MIKTFSLNKYLSFFKLPSNLIQISTDLEKVTTLHNLKVWTSISVCLCAWLFIMKIKWCKKVEPHNCICHIHQETTVLRFPFFFFRFILRFTFGRSSTVWLCNSLWYARNTCVTALLTSSIVLIVGAVNTSDRTSSSRLATFFCRAAATFSLALLARSRAFAASSAFAAALVRSGGSGARNGAAGEQIFTANIHKWQRSIKARVNRIPKKKKKKRTFLC